MMKNPYNGLLIKGFLSYVLFLYTATKNLFLSTAFSGFFLVLILMYYFCTLRQKTFFYQPRSPDFLVLVLMYYFCTLRKKTFFVSTVFSEFLSFYLCNFVLFATRGILYSVNIKCFVSGAKRYCLQRFHVWQRKAIGIDNCSLFELG